MKSAAAAACTTSVAVAVRETPPLVPVTVNVAQSAEEAEMQAKGVDPLRLALQAAAREATEQAEAAQPSAVEESVAEVPVKD